MVPVFIRLSHIHAHVLWIHDATIPRHCLSSLKGCVEFVDVATMKRDHHLTADARDLERVVNKRPYRRKPRVFVEKIKLWFQTLIHIFSCSCYDFYPEIRSRDIRMDVS